MKNEIDEYKQANEVAESAAEKTKILVFLRELSDMRTKPWTINRKINLGRLEIAFEMRSSKNFMGRFGGGWNWKVGIEWSRSTVIIFMLVAMLKFYWKKPSKG